MLTAEQAQTGLAALIGAGGISGILISFFGFLTAARGGRKPEETPTIAFGGPEGKSAEPSAIALQTIATHLCRISAIMEIEADERWEGKDFRDRVNDRMMRLMINDMKGGRD